MYEKVQLHEQFLLLKNAFQAEAAVSYHDRKKNLKQLYVLLKENAAALTKAVNQDFGHRSTEETQLLEIIPTLEAIKYSLKHLKKWMAPQRQPVSCWYKFGMAYIVPQPLGVVGVVTPWNYPIQLSMVPLMTALSAGNKAMIKMSKSSAHTAALLKQLLGSIFSNEQVQIICGDSEISKYFVELPFDHLFFTGSSQTGSKVMSKAGEHLTPVTLELGGKSPVIIAPDYPIEKAVDRILFGKLLNAGQTCVAPDYVLLPQGKEQEFINHALEYMRKHYPHLDNNDDYSCVINQLQVERLEQLCHDASKKGARVVELTHCPHDDEYPTKIFPRVLVNVTDDMQVMKEEIFGPVLPLVRYQNIDDALKYINHRPHPLALYIFDTNRKRIQQVLNETTSGGVTVNDTLLHVAQEALPFGGVGMSGMGQYHGKAGFDTLTHYKSIFFQSKWNGLKFMTPPFSKIVKFIIRLQLR